MNNELHKISLESSKDASGWLQRQPGVKEESITDWLLDFFDQKSNNVSYYQFTRHEEAKSSGADWDWWILYPKMKGCFKMRVQAKRIRKHHDHYQDITRTNQSGFQIDMLLNSSAQLNFYPIYAHYGLSEGVERCSRTPSPEALFVSSAQEMYDFIFGAPRTKVEYVDILKMCIPMPCVFGCPLVDKNGISSLFSHYFQSAPRSIEGEKDNENNSSRGLEREVPQIIRELTKIKERNSNTEGLFQEYKNKYAGSNGFTIFNMEETEIG
jgi:hypothetical protein